MNNIWEQKYRDNGFSSQKEYPNESLIAFIKGLDGKRVLEVGCGSGANTWMLVKEGLDVYGIDYSKKGIEYCKKMLKKYCVSANLKVGDMCKLPYDNNMFNAIVDVVSVQHLNFKEHIKCLKDIYRCLKLGGQIFSFHLGENSISYLHSGGKLIDTDTIDNIKDITKPLNNNGQICFLSANEYRNMLMGIGFKNIVIDKVIRTYNNQEYQIEYLVVRAEK